jgi:hypothetical protein
MFGLKARSAKKLGLDSGQRPGLLAAVCEDQSVAPETDNLSKWKVFAFAKELVNRI